MRFRLLVPIIVLAVVAAACGDDDTGDATAASTTTQPSGTTTAAGGVTTTAAATTSTTTTTVATGPDVVYITDWENGLVTRTDIDSGGCIVADAGLTGDLIAIGHGFLWVTDCLGGQLVRFDMETLEETGRIDLGDCPSGVAITDERVWVALRDSGVLIGLDPETGEILAEVLAPGPINGLFDGSVGVFGMDYIASIMNGDILTGTGNMLSNVADSFVAWMSGDYGYPGNVSTYNATTYQVIASTGSDHGQTTVYDVPKAGGPPVVRQTFPGWLYAGSGWLPRMLFVLLDKLENLVHIYNGGSWTSFAVDHPRAPDTGGRGFGSSTTSTWYRIDPDRLPPGGPPGQPGAPPVGPGFDPIPITCEIPAGNGGPIAFNLALLAPAAVRANVGAAGINPGLFPHDAIRTEPIHGPDVPTTFVNSCGLGYSGGAVSGLNASISSGEAGQTILVDVERADGTVQPAVIEMTTDDQGMAEYDEFAVETYGLSPTERFVVWFRTVMDPILTGCSIPVNDG